MLKTKPAFFAVFFIVLTFSCSFLNEEKDKSQLIEQDKKALNDNISNYKTLLYKFFKLNTKIAYMDSLELAKLTQKHPEIIDITEGFNVFIQNSKLTASGSELSVLDYIKLYRTFTKTKNAVKDFNEDSLPPFSRASTTLNTNLKNLKAAEHILLAGFSLILKDLGLPVCFYELSMVDPENLPEGKTKASVVTARSIMLYFNELYYLSEDELTDNIQWIEANPNENFNISLELNNGQDATITSKMRAKILIFNYLLRGLDRLKMDNEAAEKDALDDFESIIAIAEESEIDNEITQAVKVFFYTKNEDSERAIRALKKLKTSKILSKKEKEPISKSITYLEQREPDKVLNGVYDKLFLSKIVLSYVTAQAQEADWEQLLKENNMETSQEVKSTIETIKNLVENIEKYKSTEHIEEAGEKLKETTKDLWNKAKDIVD